MNPIYGVIKYECHATNVTGLTDGAGEVLKTGTLIQIVPDFRKENCYFKIRDFTNWVDHYKTTIYKCPVDSYISVSTKLWPYLCTMASENRVQFVQNAYNGTYNLDLLELNHEIRIRTPTHHEADYFEFIVKYVGPVEEMGIGYYIGLQLKNKHDSLPVEWKCMSQYYNFGGEGIAVSANWIMINLFKEHQYARKLCFTSDNEHSEQRNIPIKKSNEVLKECPEISNTCCPNKECNYSWINRRNDHTNNVRCPQCRTNWCYICNNAHEPGERHGSKSSELPDHVATKTRSSNEMGAIPKVPKKKCAKCNLCSKIFELDAIVSLQKCQHFFCKSCMKSYVERNSKCSTIRCPYTDGKCHFNLEDAEIKNFGGELIYNEILDNRLREALGSDPNARVCPNNDCKYVWNMPQTSHINNSRCPKCKTNKCYICHTAHEPGSPHGIKPELGKRNVEEPFKKTAVCDKCYTLNIPLVGFISLQNCNHNFCSECIVSTIKTQTSESTYAQCPICNKILEDDEVSKLAGSTVLQLFQRNRKQPNNEDEKKCTKFKANLGSTKNIAKSVIVLNDQPFLCIICEQQISVNRGVMFNRCHHSFCLACCREFIDQQILSALIPACPICRRPLHKFEVDGIMLKNSQGITCTRTKIEPTPPIFNKQNINENPIVNIQPVISKKVSFQRRKSSSDISNATCSVCYGNFKNKIILKECSHEFCRQCVLMSITTQQSNGKAPTCPMCRNPIDPDQMILRSSTSSKRHSLMEADREANARKLNHTPNTPLQLNDLPFQCIICAEYIRPLLGIVLSNCGDLLCKDCAYNVILQQSALVSPTCPLCQSVISDNDVRELAPGVYDIFLENRGPLNNFAGPHPRHGMRKTSLETYNEDVCSVCNANFRQKTMLTNCRHEFCCRCILRKIKTYRSEGSRPTCPKCRKIIAPDQIAMFINMGEYQENLKFETKLRLNYKQFECPICDQVVDEGCGVILSNCRDTFCLICITNVLLQQSASNLSPKCPMCQKQITYNEVQMIDATIHDIFLENQRNK